MEEKDNTSATKKLKRNTDNSDKTKTMCEEFVKVFNNYKARTDEKELLEALKGLVEAKFGGQNVEHAAKDRGD